MVFESAELRDRVAKEFGAVEGLQQTLAHLEEELRVMASGAFVISRTFGAPRDLMWKVWTEEERLQKWFGPKASSSALSPRILAILRILAGIMFACHGAQKLFGAFGAMPPGVPKALIWTAGPLEFVGGILIAIGLFTRVAAFLDSGQMAIAYFVGHAPNGFWPKLNGGEIAVLYCWLFLYIAAQGPGAWAVDNLMRKRVST